MQFDQLRRREFITLLGGAAVAWPLAASAQQSDRIRRIGVLSIYAENDPENKARLAAFQGELERFGWSEGRNARIDYRYDVLSVDQAQVVAKELVALQPDVILAQSPPVVAALQRETRAIPIVFVSVSDPIGPGFVASLARPGGNITGLQVYEESIAGKWLVMLKEIAPRLVRAAFLANPKTTEFDYFLRVAQAAAPSLAIEIVPSPIETAADIERTIESFARLPNGGLLLAPDGTTTANRDLRHARGQAPSASGLRAPYIRRSRGSHVLRDRFCRHVSAGGVLCRSCLTRGQTGRSSGTDAYQIRNNPQS